MSVVRASGVGAHESVHVAADLKLEGLDDKLVGDEKERDPCDEDREDRREEYPVPAREEEAFLEEVQRGVVELGLVAAMAQWLELRQKDERNVNVLRL